MRLSTADHAALASREPATASHGASARRADGSLWYLTWTEPPPDASLEALSALLSVEEEQRAAALATRRAREQFVLARALARSVLAAGAGIPPARLAIRMTAHGRPEIFAPSCLRTTRFSITHTRGLVALAVSTRGEIGVDAESLDRPRLRPLRLAERWFAASEVALVRGTAAPRQRSRALDLWTLKEAYLKARGIGLAHPLQEIEFRLDRSAGIRLIATTCDSDDPRAWRFRLLRTASGHGLALAARTGVSGRIRWRRLRRVSLPLGSQATSDHRRWSWPTLRAGAWEWCVGNASEGAERVRPA